MANSAICHFLRNHLKFCSEKLFSSVIMMRTELFSLAHFFSIIVNELYTLKAYLWFDWQIITSHLRQIILAFKCHSCSLHNDHIFPQQEIPEGREVVLGRRWGGGGIVCKLSELCRRISGTWFVTKYLKKMFCVLSIKHQLKVDKSMNKSIFQKSLLFFKF